MANNNVQAQEIESLNMKEAFFMKYKKAIMIAVVALIVIIAGVFAYMSQIAGPREDKASTLLGKGQTYFQNEMYEQALNGDGAGYVGFAKIASEYGSTDAGNLANLYAGLCYANLGKWAEAEKSLDAFSSKDDEMISPAAQAALGDAYAHLNKLDDAVAAFKKAASMADSKAEDDANNSLSPAFLIKAGEILESQNKKAEALSIYQDIKKKYVNSMLVQSSEIDKYIVIALKLAQFSFLQRTCSNTTPLLLLDDIFDKLDAQRVEAIVQLVSSDSFGQIFITDTNRDHLDQILHRLNGDFRIFEVNNGEIAYV